MQPVLQSKQGLTSICRTLPAWHRGCSKIEWQRY